MRKIETVIDVSVCVCVCVTVDQVQGGRTEGTVFFSVFYTSSNSSNGAGEGGDRAAESGVMIPEQLLLNSTFESLSAALLSVHTFFLYKTPVFFFSVFCVAQVKYKEDCKKETGSSLYHLLPETAETHFAKEMSEIQSEVMSTFFAQHFYDCLFFSVFVHCSVLSPPGEVQEGQGGSERHALLSAA